MMLSALRLIQPGITKKVETPPVNAEALKKVFDVISNGFNMTKNDISKNLMLSHTYVSSLVNKLFDLGVLSKINIKEGMAGRCTYAYTTIKPLKGDL